MVLSPNIFNRFCAWVQGIPIVFIRKRNQHARNISVSVGVSAEDVFPVALHQLVRPRTETFSEGASRWDCLACAANSDSLLIPVRVFSASPIVASQRGFSPAPLLTVWMKPQGGRWGFPATQPPPLPNLSPQFLQRSPQAPAPLSQRSYSTTSMGSLACWHWLIKLMQGPAQSNRPIFC